MGAKKVAGAAYQAADRLGAQWATNWIRPPFAAREPDFLHNCTRCDKCVDGCPHDVLFTLPARCGTELAGTPAMDLLKKGCHLCSDWPCVTACETEALKKPDPDDGKALPLPKFAVARIVEGTWLPYSGPECGACAASCPVPGALTWLGNVKPVIEQGLCTGCALCREACITDPKSVDIAVFIPRPNGGDGETTVSEQNRLCR